MFWRIVRNLKNYIEKCKTDNIAAFAAQSAFFLLLSAIPFLMVFSSLLKYTPVTEAIINKMIDRTLPGYISPFCISIIHEVYNKSVAIVSVTAVLAIWSAAKGIHFLSGGLNAVYKIPETRNWFVLRAWAALDTLIFMITIVVSLVLLVFGNTLKKLVLSYFPIITPIMNAIMDMRKLIFFVILIVFFSVLYKLLPNRKASLKSQLPGAALSAVGWYVFSLGLSIYVEYFDGFSMYGSLTTIVLIMLWLYFCMYILLACAEFNVMFEDYIRKQVWRFRRYRERRKKESGKKASPGK